MEEALQVIRTFNMKRAAQKEAKPEAEKDITDQVPAAPGLDEKPARDVQEETAPKKSRKSALRVIQGGANRTSNTVQAVAPDLTDMPTPGGIGLLLTIILVILFVIVKVTTANGKSMTRMSLIWQGIASNNLSITPSGGGSGSGVNPYSILQMGPNAILSDSSAAHQLPVGVR